MDKRILLLPALAAALASAQGTAPADAARAAAPIPYRSTFAGYRAWQEPAPMDWREANETAGALGGHMGHVRGHVGGRSSSTGSAPPAAPPRPDAASVPAKPVAVKP
jgi:hypothetical protein